MLNRAASVLVLTIAFAVSVQGYGRLTPAQRWNLKLRERSRLLKSGDYAGSLKIADRIRQFGFVMMLGDDEIIVPE